MHQFFQEFCYDPAIPGRNQEVYRYKPEEVDHYYDHHLTTGRIHYAIESDGHIIGDIYLKNIDTLQRSCEIGIHMMNDTYKNKGYGTTALKQMIQRITEEQRFEFVFAKTTDNNVRCIRMLKKTGFNETEQNNGCLVYTYRITENKPVKP